MCVREDLALPWGGDRRMRLEGSHGVLVGLLTRLSPPLPPSAGVRRLVQGGLATVRSAVAGLVTDPSGQETATQRVPFSYRGVDYLVALPPTRARQFDDLMGGYIEAAQPVRVPRARAARVAGRVAGGDSTSGPSARQVRDWARSQGMEVAGRGRVSGDLVRRYAEAHPA